MKQTKTVEEAMNDYIPPTWLKTLRSEIENNTELGLQAKAILDNGNLLPEDIIKKLVEITNS